MVDCFLRMMMLTLLVQLVLASPPHLVMVLTDDNGWASYHEDPTQLYEIESIVSATRVGGGWSLGVKWKGYPQSTDVALSRL